MLPVTHFLISEHLYKSLEKQGIKLSKTSLAIGSLVPDFSPKYKICSHYITSSFDFLLNTILELNRDFYNNKLSLNGFSYKLGIITHYVSDFFCTAHNDAHLKKNIYDHFIYEKDLHIFFKNPNPPTTDIINLPEYFDRNYVGDFLNLLLSYYIKDSNVSSYEKDVYHTLKATHQFSKYIFINSCLQNSNLANLNLSTNQ